MTRISAQSLRMGKFWPFVFALLFLGDAERCMGDGTCLYQGEDGAGFLRIERLPDAHIVPMPSHSVTMQTKNGEKELIRFSNGDCKSICHDLLWGSGNPEAVGWHALIRAWWRRGMIVHFHRLATSVIANLSPTQCPCPAVSKQRGSKRPWGSGRD